MANASPAVSGPEEFTTQTTLPTLAEIQAPVRERLDRTLGEMRRVASAGLGVDVQAIGEHLLGSRGKLLRPTLLLLSNQVGGDQPGTKTETVAAVVELLHLATLVHDDAVDRSELRRGLPTVNAVWSHQIAVIMGDFLYSRCMVELARLGQLEAIRALADAANRMTLGELDQLSADLLAWDQKDYFRLIERKTASLFGAACEIGALMSEAPYHREALGQFGREIGMAFQIADDLLDYTADAEATGKPAGLDLRERKVTLPLLAVLPSLSGSERTELETFFAGSQADEAVLQRVARWVRERGGLDYAKRVAREYANRADAALVGLPAGPATAALRASVVYAVERRR